MKLPGGYEIEILDKQGNVPLEVYFGGIFVAICCFLLSLIPAHFISMLISSTYRNGKRRISWYSYCLSQFHGPTSGWFAIYCVMTTDPGVNGFNWYFSVTEAQALCVLWTLGYMVTDLAMVFFFQKEFGFPQFLIFHHTLIVITYSLGLLHNPSVGTYFMCAFQAQELTATFLANRWFLLECDMKFSKSYLWNGAFLVLGYITTRVFYGNFVLYRVVKYLPDEVLANFYYSMIFGCAVVFQLLQYYFFYGIISTTFKYLQQRKLFLEGKLPNESKKGQ